MSRIIGDTIGYNFRGLILPLNKSEANCLIRGDVVRSPGGKFKGELTDIWGSSVIEGSLKFREGELSFARKYEYVKHKGLIYYALKRDGPMWIGAYSGNLVGIGQIKCEIYAETPRIDWRTKRSLERMDPHKMDEAIAFVKKKMVEDGFFSMSKNSDGKEKLELTDKTMEFAREIQLIKR